EAGPDLIEAISFIGEQTADQVKLPTEEELEQEGEELEENDVRLANQVVTTFNADLDGTQTAMQQARTALVADKQVLMDARSDAEHDYDKATKGKHKGKGDF